MPSGVKAAPGRGANRASDGSCTPAFIMTDQKSPGKHFVEVLLYLKGA